MELRTAVDKLDHEEVINQIDGLMHQIEDVDLKNQLRIVQLIGLVKADKLKRASEFIKVYQETLTKNKDYDYVYRYLLYKESKFDELNKLIVQKSDTSTEVKNLILNAQVLYKQERYDESLSIYFKLLENEEIKSLNLIDEIIINASCLITFLVLTENAFKSKLLDFKQGIINFLTFLMQRDQESFEMREVFINLIIMLLTLNKSEIIDLRQVLGNEFNLIQAGENYIKRIEKSLKEEEEKEGMEIEDDETEISHLNTLEGDKLIDYLTLFVLRTFVMQMKQTISWKQSEIEELKELLLSKKIDDNNNQLRVALLSYLVFIETLSEDKSGLPKLFQLIDEELKNLKKTSKVSGYLMNRLYHNKAVIHLQLQNVAETKKIIKKELKYNENNLDISMLPIELSIFIKNKNYKEFENKKNVIAGMGLAKNKRMNCIYYLFQLAFFYNLNNQKKYIDCFVEFLNNFFIPELNLPSEMRFLDPQVFTQFAKVVVFYMLRNTTILNRLKEKIIKFVEFIEDSKTVAKIAEGFLEKKDYVVAETIYKVLVSKNPTDFLLSSRLNFIYSIVAPEKIDDAMLPEFDIIKDFNSLRNLENDYLKKIKEEVTKYEPKQENKMVIEKPVKTKKKKRRIMWPKNFDFENPGKRPDPERWIPRIERAKYRKIAIKKGQYTKTQGVTVSDQKTQDLYKNQHSTANQKITKQRKKKKRGKK